MKRHSLMLEELVLAREGAPLSDPLSLTVEAGHMVAIHGSNGSGKTTLLKTIAGLVPIYQGGVRFKTTHLQADGVESVELAVFPWESTVNPLYHSHRRGLVPSMSVIDNVAFWGKVAGYPELINAALHYFDLEDITDTRVETLSAGWQQRVALTRLITMPSPLWLLDEPTSNLDAEGIELLHSLMQTRMEQGGIILVATHMELKGEKVHKLKINMLSAYPNVEAVL